MEQRTKPKPFPSADELANLAQMDSELVELVQEDVKPGGVTYVKDVGALISTRQSTHGDFRTNARMSQKLKAVVRSYEGWEHLDDVEKESIDMICLKLSRIISGKSLEKQHWEDVEGYARLAVKECKQ